MTDDYDETITIFYKERYNGEWMPANLAEAISWLQGKLELVPPEYRERAIIELDSESGYEDSHYPSIEIRYRRPPTPKEIADRIAKREANRVAEIARLENILQNMRNPK